MRPRPPVVGPCLAWWQRDADRVLRNMCKTSFALDVDPTGFDGRQALAPAALDEMPQIALPFLLDAAGGKSALFVLDGPLIDGLIEQQLLGRILPIKRLDRPVTSIDAGLSEGFVEAALAAIGAQAPGPLAGLSAKSAQQDRAALRLALGEGLYDILSVSLDMGPGVKTGGFELWIPSPPDTPPKSAKRRVNPDMVAILQDCEIELEARMEGCVATAKQLMSLKVGSVLAMPKAEISRVELFDPSGNLFAKGRLGQLNGMRAVRLGKLAYSRPEPPAVEAAPAAALPAAQVQEPDPVADVAASPEGAEGTTTQGDAGAD